MKLTYAAVSRNVGIHVTAIMRLQEAVLLTHVRNLEEGLTIARPSICPSTTHYQSTWRHTHENCDLQNGNQLEH